MPRGRPRKQPVEATVSAVEHKIEALQSDAANKASNKVVDEWVSLQNGKLIKNRKMSNGNIYRNYLGAEFVKQVSTDGLATEKIINPSIAEFKKQGVFR